MIDLKRHYIFDGGMGTMLQASGLKTGHNPEKLNISNPEDIKAIHTAYAAAGADIITTNTFGASRRKMEEDPTPYIEAGVRLAKEAAEPYGALVALDVGPLGTLLEPFGEMTFDEAYENFVEIVTVGAAAGADLILIETMSDLLEAKAALLAAKEHSNLPVFVTMTFGEDGKTFIGTDPGAAAVTLTSLGADVIGVNCSLGPDALMPVVEVLLKSTHLPVMVQPNAGLPKLVDGRTVFDVSAGDFAFYAEKFLDAGVAILGGCCGTTPEHICAVRECIGERQTLPRERGNDAVLCGWQGIVVCGDTTTRVVGERINPTGRKKLSEAIRCKNWEYVAELAIEQQECGADFIVVNAGLPDVDQSEALPAMVLAIQKVSPLPLVIDCSDAIALEKALRVCRGRPILNSVNGSEESLRDILPLASKYGTGLIVLALEGNGIADTAVGRVETALRITERVEQSGVLKKDIFVDCLALSASVDQKNVFVTSDAIKMVRERGYKTVLGVSNVSFGLPERDAINCAFLAVCLATGLNIAIVDTESERIMDTMDAARVLTGEDAGCVNYLRRGKKKTVAPKQETSLEMMIITGRKSDVPAAVKELLETKSPLEVISRHIIPALDSVGEEYETGRMFLPQLMTSADAVKTAFGVLEAYLPAASSGKNTIILATVRGDIHDIGKNIVRMLLENYGYRVIDLGKDVAEDEVVRAVQESGAKLVGLSALMTTTAQNMVPVIRTLHEKCSDCKVMIGGAVVTREFAEQIGADYYAKDAAQSARIAAEVYGS